MGPPRARGRERRRSARGGAAGRPARPGRSPRTARCRRPPGSVPGRRRVDHQLAGGRRHEDLPAVGCVPQPGPRLTVAPKIASAARRRRCGPPSARRAGRGLPQSGGPAGSWAARAAATASDATANTAQKPSPGWPNTWPPMVARWRPGQGVVGPQGDAHRLGVAVPAGRAVLDVGEQEGGQGAAGVGTGGGRASRQSSAGPGRGSPAPGRPARRRGDVGLLGQDVAQPVVGPQRLGLAAGPVQGRHELAPRRLPPGLALDQVLQLAHRSRCWPSARQASTPHSTVAHRSSSSWLARGPAKSWSANSPRGVAPPAGQGVGGRVAAACPAAGPEGGAGPAGGVLEGEGVQLVGGAAQRVAGPRPELDTVAPSAVRSGTPGSGGCWRRRPAGGRATARPSGRRSGRPRWRARRARPAGYGSWAADPSCRSPSLTSRGPRECRFSRRRTSQPHPGA